MFRLSRVSAHLTGGSPNDHSGWQAAARAVLTAAAAASEPSPSGNPESIVKLNQQMQRVTAASPALPSRLPVRSSPVADTTESVDFSRTFMTFRIDSLKKEVLTSGHSRRGDEERLFSARTRSLPAAPPSPLLA